MEIIDKAKVLEFLGKKEDAAQAYLKAASDADKTWAYCKAGDAYLSLGKIGLAKKAYDNIINCGIYPLYDCLIDFYLKIKEFNKASELFEQCFPYAAHSKKMTFADKLLSLGAFNLAQYWYLNSVDNVCEDKHPYLKKIGEHDEKFGVFRLKRITKADDSFFQGNYKSALSSYKGLLKSSKYAKTKTAECCFLLRNFDAAKAIYRELVQETDDPYYMFMLGECYNCEDVAVNTLENAVYWFEYSLQNGCKYPCYHLGICYQFGLGVDDDLDKAIQLFELGATEEIDKANCLCKLGNIYYHKGEIEKATQYYRRAADLGNLRALLNIAIAYFEKEIPFFSFEEIKCFLAKSAALGSKRAYDMLLKVEMANDKDFNK